MDKMGAALIEAINRNFKTKIELSEENAASLSDLVNDIIIEHDYGYCDNCDRRVSY